VAKSTASVDMKGRGMRSWKMGQGANAINRYSSLWSTDVKVGLQVNCYLFNEDFHEMQKFLHCNLRCTILK